jgi:enamine deaminase RidA (YjgF/YER057c/UK114 family)
MRPCKSFVFLFQKTIMKKRLSQVWLGLRSQWQQWVIVALCTTLFSVGLFTFAAQAVRPPRTVTFTLPTNAASPISQGVAFPANAAFYFTSGTVPPVINPAGAPNTTEQFGDTYTQAKGTLERIKTLLIAQGLGLKDVAFLICYLVPDPALADKVDYQGWFKAYGEYFNNPENPVKTARSTLGVQGLVNPGWLVEIEAIAVYPK